MPPKSSPRPPLTHFLCIPLVTESSRPILERSINAFRNDVFGQRSLAASASSNSASTASERLVLEDLSERALRPVGTLHLTLGVMSLREPKMVDNAVKLLHELDLKQLLREAAEVASSSEGKDRHVLRKVDAGTEPGLGRTEDSGCIVQPLRISLASLHPMQSPSKTSTLYAAPHDSTNRLAPLCARLQAIFLREHHMIDENRPLKLHATIINTIYSSNQSRSRRGRGRGRAMQFDATDLIDAYKDYEWAADITVDRIAICKMGAQKLRGEDGEVVDEAYEEVATKSLPA